MKTVVLKKTGVSLYIVEDSTPIMLYDTYMVCGNDQIVDLNKNTAEVFDNVNKPDGWAGGHFTYIDGVWEDITSGIEKKRSDDVAIQIRTERNKRLADTDWRVTYEVEKASNDGLGITVPTVWTTYRQALRDITAQPGFPHNVTWPEEPTT